MSMFLEKIHLRRRTHAAAIHLIVSLGVASVAALLVFVLWYPGPFQALAGGRELFMLVTTVDVVMGPMLTFAVFDPGKGIRRLQGDLLVIGVLQAFALAYGLHTTFDVRPVGVVFEVDRFRVITAADVYQAELPEAREAFRNLPWTGPWLLGTRKPNAGPESNEVLFMSLRGVDVAQRPKFWQPYADSAASAVQRSRPISQLSARYPNRAAEIATALRRRSVAVETARFLPVNARGDWVALLDGRGSIVDYLPLDGFF